MKKRTAIMPRERITPARASFETFKHDGKQQHAVPGNSDAHTNVADKKIRPRSRSKSTRKRKRCSNSSSSSTDEDLVDQHIEEKLQQSAFRNNLTHENVKNIIQKVVRNDHVLAICKLREEDMVKEEQARKMLSYHTDTDELTLTRAKAKALNKMPLPVAPITRLEPDSEVVQLIGGELQSDDEDEEYQPGDEDIESDDDPNTTTSDIDSQPRTPQTKYHTDNDDDVDRPQFSIDGLFKIPRARNDSSNSFGEQEYNLAQRTRSKISLAETPIETLERTLRAPDFTTDMYDNVECDDNDWVQFLSTFSMPLSMIESDQNIEIEDEADPDYVAADRPTVDKEELRQVNIGKKEVNDLFNELYESLWDVDFEEPNAYLPALIDNNKSNAGRRSPSTLTTPTKELDDSATTVTTKAQEKTPDRAPNTSRFEPQSVSTPFVNKTVTHTTVTTTQDLSNASETAAIADKTLITEPISSMPNAVGNSYQYPINPVTFSPLKEIQSIVILPFNSISGSSHTLLPNGLFACAPTIANIPSTTQLNSTNAKNTHIAKQLSLANSSLNCLNQQIECGRGSKSKLNTSRHQRCDLDKLDPNTIVTPVFPDGAVGFTPKQKEILDQQLRMHVQLATQGFLQVHKHPEIKKGEKVFKEFLTEFNKIIEESKTGVIKIINLKWALDLIREWEAELAPATEENIEFAEFIVDELAKYRKTRAEHNKYFRMIFHSRIMHKISNSKVFMYPALLPTVPFYDEISKTNKFIPAEEHYIANSMEHYFKELPLRRFALHGYRSKPITLMDVCKQIAADIKYFRTAESIYDCVRFKKSKRSKKMNPIQYYLKHKKAPPMKHVIEPFDENAILAPAKRTLPELPHNWADFIEKIIGYQHDYLLERCANSKNTIQNIQLELNSDESYDVAIDTKSNDALIVSQQESPNAINSTLKANVSDRHHNVVNAQKINANYSTLSKCTEHHLSVTNNNKSGDFNCSYQELEKGQTLLTSFFSYVRNKTEEGREIRLQKIKEKYESARNKSQQSLAIHRSESIKHKYRRQLIALHKKHKHLIEKLQRVRTVVRAKYEYENYQNSRRHIDIWFLNICFKAFDVYTSALWNLNNRNMKKASRSNAIEVIAAGRGMQKLQTITIAEATPTAVDGTIPPAGGVAIVNTDSASRRLIRGNKTADNVRMMFLTDSKEETMEKDALFAQQYFDKVKETVLASNDENKFSEFLSILKNFDETNDTAGDLYLKLEQLFLPTHPHLASIFLNFLQPSDAIQIGKFMEHFLSKNMTTFMNKLNIFFHKQPAQMRKIHNCLRDLSDDPDLNLDHIKSKLLPLLKGHQLLVNWFLECIGDSSIIDSAPSDYETLVCRKPTDAIDDETDTYENIPHSEIQPDPIENPCSLRYMNGGIYYGNRTFSPAKLSFTVNTEGEISGDDDGGHERRTTDEAATMVEAKDGQALSFRYRCVHEIKQIGDARIRDQSKCPSDSDTNAIGCDDGDDSEDENLRNMAVDVGDYRNSDAIIESSYAPSAHSKNLCEDILLKAHGIRLNPSFHSSITFNNNEMLNMLKPSYKTSEKPQDTEKEAKLSPKKPTTSKCLTPTQLKIHRKLSPNSKKISTLNRSPNSKRNTLPLNPNNALSNTTNVPSSDSPAIQTAKKLKRYIDSNESISFSSIDDEPNPSELNLRKCLARRIPKVHRQKPKQMIYNSTDEQQHEEPSLSLPSTSSTWDRCKEDESGINADKEEDKADGTAIKTMSVWTRDEDRLLLEQIKSSVNTNIDIVEGISHKFPERRIEDIEERIEFLLDFLNKLQNKS